MTTPASLRRTPLTSAHEAAGARLVDFSGTLMPVQYDGILEEARRVRAAGGLFDLCHMGRVAITGARHREAAQKLVHVNVGKLKQGAIRYSFLCREDGTTLDDILIYRDEDETFFCINAGNRERDIEWMRDVAEDHGCALEDRSDELAMIAIQGPASVATLAPLCDEDPGQLKYYGFRYGTVCDLRSMISRTGYTGEDGFELYFEADRALDVWNALLESGKAHGITPIGLGARDTLRLEAGMALYGHELDDSTNPVEAGLVSAPIKHAHDFIGRAAIEAVVRAGPVRRLVGFTTESARVPRQGYPLALPDGGPEVGAVCSGSPSPTLDTNIGTGYVRTPSAGAPTLDMLVRGQRHPVQLVPLPFYKRAR
ncbi:MAG: glycine cleavage system aminomethyltransferase GcvT [Planctomycetota bacterium]|jgi:aminomethyltransferase